MTNVILRNEPLTHPWAGTDPFLFCARHQDLFPAADENQGVAREAIEAHASGSGAGGRDFSMYYGTTVPGFPAHPHRGFETVTIVPTGLVDHADSLGATARYGDGDVQWLTAGRGVMHSEMFPLRDTTGQNPLDLYQIWLNLPARSKMADPAFAMLWDGAIPRYRFDNDRGATAVVKVIAGEYRPYERQGPAIVPPAPTPNSWAAHPGAELAIWQITLDPGASLTLPPARGNAVRRTLYFHVGKGIEIAGEAVARERLIEVSATTPLKLVNGKDGPAELLLLQAVPIGEPVVAEGPFVMNSRAEILQARQDFGRTQFGGWPWRDPGPVHERGQARFAKYPGEQGMELRRATPGE